jgi:hypothetical protein
MADLARPTLAEIRDALADLGRMLAAYRVAAGLTQHDLARLLFYSRSTVATIETGRERGTAQFWERADRVLSAAGVLSKAHAAIEHMCRARAAALARHGRKRCPACGQPVNPSDVGQGGMPRAVQA